MEHWNYHLDGMLYGIFLLLFYDLVNDVLVGIR